MDWTFQRIAVVGSGAIGLYYGGRLAAAGEDLTFLVRSDYDAIRRDGLQAKSIHGDFHLQPAQAARSAADIGPVDLVIVAWKATSNHLLEEVLPPLLHPGTQVLTLQNGLGNCEAIAAITGPERVLGGLCFVCINRTAPAVIHHSGGARVTVGEFATGLPGRATEVARRFKAAGIPIEAVPSLQQSQWEKLIWNIPFNGLSVAEGGVTTDVLLATPGMEDHIRALMNEVVMASRALGLDMPGHLIDFNIERTRPMGPYRTSSMIDFVEGRELEIEPIWREPARQARAAGCPMPLTEALIARIEAACTPR